MNVFELFGTIAINNEQANKALSDTGKQAKGLSNTMEAAFSKMQGTARKIGAAIATAFAVDKIKDFGQSCAQTFASVAAEESAFAQIMGDYAERATEKMQYVAEKTGMVTTRLTPYMTSMTAKFKGLGYGVDEATNLAAEGLQIAADASAFWDKSLDESMSHLNSFINGSYEGGEAIGLFANDTQMAAYAVQKGIVKEKKAWSELDEARKQATRLEYAKEMMKSSGATGQAALEAEAYANVQANLTEQMRQFHSVIGEPIMNNIMLPAMRRLSQYMPMITEKTEAFLTKYTSGLKRFAGYFSKMFTKDGIDLSALPSALSTALSNIWPKLNGLLMLNFGFAFPHWKDIETKISTWWPPTKRAVENLCTWALQLPSNPDGSIKMMALTVKGWWETVGLPAVKSVSKWSLNLFDHPIEDDATIAAHIGEWWKVAGNRVASACSWTLQLFGEPKESAEQVGSLISTWWDGIVNTIVDICMIPVSLNPTAADGEGVPWFTKLQTWFDAVVATNPEAFNLAIGILTNQTNEDGTRWSEVIADWFHAMVGDIGERLQVTFGVVMPTAEETAKIQQEMTTWLHGADGKSGVVGAIANAIALPFDMAFQECVNIWEEFQKWLESVSNTGTLNTETYEESEWTKGAKYDYRLLGHEGQEWEAFNKWVQATNAFREVEKSGDLYADYEALQADVDAARNAIESAFGKGTFDSLMTDYMSWLGGQVDAETQDYFKEVPLSLAEGTAAELQNEITGLDLEAPVTLVPDYSRINSAISSLGSRVVGTVPTVRWNAEGGIFDRPTIFSTRAGLQGVGEAGAEAIAPIGVLQKYVSDAVASQNAGMVSVLQSMLSTLNQISVNTAGGQQVVLDSGVLVGQIAPAMDMQLGTISGRKGRRN